MIESIQDSYGSGGWRVARCAWRRLEREAADSQSQIGTVKGILLQRSSHKLEQCSRGRIIGQTKAFVEF
jgi:hypothetical protein